MIQHFRSFTCLNTFEQLRGYKYRIQESVFQFIICHIDSSYLRYDSPFLL